MKKAAFILWGIGLLIIVGIGYSLISNTSTSIVSRTASAPLPQTQVNQVSLSNIRLNKNQFLYTPDQYVFTADVQNGSIYTFTYLHITVNAYDCPSTVINSSCTQIGQDSGEIAGVGNGASIPANQERQMTAFINLTGIPPVQGNFEWSYAIDSVEP